MGYIYKITNIITGKCYIGETTQDYNRRWNKHINSLKYKEGCPLLKASMKKHGIQNFTFEILIICFNEDLIKYEREYIKKYNSQTPNGYNILAFGQIGDGHIGYKHTQETINKMKESRIKFIENNPDHYETYRERHQETMKTIDISSCVKNSEKFKKAIIEQRVGATSHKDGQLSDESKKKISESLLLYYKNNTVNSTTIDKRREIMTKSRGKAINQYSKDNIHIAHYNSISEAGRMVNISKSVIQHMLSGNTKSAGGFIWKYAE